MKYQRLIVCPLRCSWLLFWFNHRKKSRQTRQKQRHLNFESGKYRNYSTHQIWNDTWSSTILTLAF